MYKKIALKINALRERAFDYILIVGSFLVPSRKGLICFYPIHDKTRFNGNLKSIFLYATRNPTNNIRVLWLTTHEALYLQLEKEGLSVKLIGKRHMWMLWRAEFIFTDAAALYRGKFKVIQVWHGTGFKNIGKLSNKRKYWRTFFNYKLFLATSADDKDRKSVSFPGADVHITGSPRNDIFFSSQDELLNIKRKYRLEKYRRIITYTPTFRDKGDFQPFSNEGWAKLSNLASSNNDVVIIKKHPSDRLLKVPDMEAIFDFTENKNITDVQELLLLTDILISDYSGIVTDFALTGKPILFYTFDYQNYKQNVRDFYYDIMEILPGPFCYDEESLCLKLSNLDWFDNPLYQVKYKKFLNRFHTHLDGRASERTWNYFNKYMI